ncbi:unnamed protein product [Allacma fusca]|uniref:Uncharacterized protein n=1 Tax=Allacma fusca TaxID=39272 RepID=A0A8J2KTF7_9HEXA|nr:unnamed protein product [Allacma fusca]
MGNAVVKENESVSDGKVASTTGSVMSAPTSVSAAPRKHSTVSTARLLLCGERIEYLTEEQKGHIRACWKVVEDDVARVGVITFMQ